MVDILLQRVEGVRAVVAEVPHPVPVPVRLVRVAGARTVVRAVQQSVIVHVRVAVVALHVTVNILLQFVAEKLGLLYNIHIPNTVHINLCNKTLKILKGHSSRFNFFNFCWDVFKFKF